MSKSPRKLNRNLVASAEDIADLFWLSSFITTLTEDQSIDQGAAPANEPTPNKIDETGEAGESVDKSKGANATVGATPVYGESSQGNALTRRRTPFRVPASTALPDRLEIGRALRPFMQRIDSRVEFTLDELRTAETSAEQRLLIPEFQPARERWFDLVLIIDTSPTMLMWYQTAVELKMLAEQTGAFRNVYVYRLTAAKNDQYSEDVILWTGLRGGRHCRGNELVDFSGRRLVVMISDCTSLAWYLGKVYALMKEWLNYIPTVIIQPIPLSMWNSTVLARCDYVYVSSLIPGSRNTELEVEFPNYWIEDEQPDEIPIPIIPLSPKLINEWARMMTGRSRYQFPAYYLPSLVNPVQKQVREPAEEPQELWEKFGNATLLARQLAGFLAAAPLQLPVMRLVQRVMLPSSRQSHLAEVLRSPLFKPQTLVTDTHPDHIQFEFQPGMRQFLLRLLFKVDKLRILKEVSRYVETYQGQWSAFRAWLENPNAASKLPNTISVGDLGESFAEVSSEVLRSIGGEYSLLAAYLGKYQKTPIILSQVLTADFIVVTALEEERDAVLDKLPGYQQLIPTNSDIRVYYQADIPVTFADGSSGSYRVILITLLGMGRVQATISTAEAIRRWQPRYVLLVGIGGGLAAEEVRPGDILISDQIVDYELQKLTATETQIRWQVHPTSARLREAARNFHNNSWRRLMKISRPAYGEPKCHIGPVASGDKVIASSEVLKRYRTDWPKLIGVEMEGGGVAVASFQEPNPPEFLMIRGVSDLADEEKGLPHIEEWCAYACDAAAAYAIGLLQSGPVPLSLLAEAKAKDKPLMTGLNRKLDDRTPYAEPPYGMMRLDSQFYIEREADRECWQEIQKPGAFTLYIQASRQMGKSSLIYRIIDRAKREDYREFVFIDFQLLPEQYLTDRENFFKEFCRLISAGLNIPPAIDLYWADPSADTVKCTDYLIKHIIPQLNKPLIIALDELERTLNSPFRTDFFGMLRVWHSRRAFDSSFDKISLFLSSSTDSYLLISNYQQSPFNVARQINLHDFTPDEVSQLNQRHQFPFRAAQLETLLKLLGGHPYLTRLAFYLVVTGKIDLKTLLGRATEDEGPFGDHLRYYYRRILQKPELKQRLAEIYKIGTCQKDQLFYQLREAGLIKQTGKKVVLRNHLYHRYFEERLNV